MNGRTRSGATLALALIAATASAHAQSSGTTAPTPEQLAGRRVLIEQAVTAQHGGDHAHALQLALQAGQIQMTPSLRALIAQEQQAVGQLGAALGTADLCVRETERDSTVRNRDAIMSTCRQVAAAVRQQVGFVTVHPPSPAPDGLRVTLRGEAMEGTMLGVPAAVQPGSVVVEATATGRLPFRREVTVATGGTVDVPLDLAADPNYHPAGSAEQHHDDTATARPVTAPAENSSGSSVLGPAVVAVLGVVGLGVGIAGYALQGSALSGCSVQGDTAYCPTPDSLQRAQQAPTYNLMGDVGVIAGGVLIVAGVAWFAVSAVTSGHEDHPPRAFRPRVTPGGVGFVF